MECANIISKCCLVGNEFLTGECINASSPSCRNELGGKVKVNKIRQVSKKEVRYEYKPQLDELLKVYFEPEVRPIVKALMKPLLNGYLESDPKPNYLLIVGYGSNGMSTDLHALIRFFKELSP